jgi:hypothetical protein
MLGTGKSRVAGMAALVQNRWGGEDLAVAQISAGDHGDPSTLAASAYASKLPCKPGLRTATDWVISLVTRTHCSRVS